ncbi:MAG: hypothetical protein L0Y71_04590 [Gemmataceae bacterium]|nr:hypothetical protein [Gemmataceae bacterium]
MPNIAFDAPRPLPLALKILGSAVVGVHLLIIAALALGAPSGEWYTPMGPSMAEGPQFVRPVTDVAVPGYLEPLRLTHNYHFASNHTAQAGVYFEVHLKDKDGQRIKTFKFPDDKALPWIRHRQQLLAQGLAQDQPVPPPQGEVLPGLQNKVELTIWEPGDQEMRLKRVPQHLVPRDRPVMMPSEWSLTLAKSYARYMCGAHHAAAAEIVRHTRDSWQPGFLFIPREAIPPNDTLVCNFGEFTRD